MEQETYQYCLLKYKNEYDIYTYILKTLQYTPIDLLWLNSVVSVMCEHNLHILLRSI